MPASDHSAFSSRSPFAWLSCLSFVSSRSSFWGGLALASLALGCSPKIGDECTVSTNCSPTGDRLCDITQPGGYCTIFNCEPDTCPGDSSCINFGTNLSPVGPACTPSQGNSPYQRSFCMEQCESDSDCRSGYACRDLSGSPPNPLGAVLAEYSRSGKVCVVPWNEAPKGTSTEVCTGSTSSGGASSGGAADGAAGDAGSSGN